MSHGLVLTTARASMTGFSESLEALQNTGPWDFRQSQFVDTRYTLGYTWWFLSDACKMFC
jgi:hypothetical protein